MRRVQVPIATSADADAPPPALPETVASCALLCGLPPEAIAEIARRLQPRSVAPGALVAVQDEPGDALFIVAEGRARVTVCGAGGREVTLGLLRPGDVFGEVALLDGSPRTANVVALSAARLLALPQQELLSLVRAFPELGLNLMREMARRLRRADEVIVGLALDDVEGRLTRTLVRLAQEEGERSPTGGLLLRRRPTQQELATMVGSSRETVSRTYTSMIRRGLLVARGRTLLLTESLLQRLPA
ncbi:MAG: Crp/Fnr family transcriptional regulator [Myxococcales bacterium]|nr:Crp/Fnr family transcriptional regulator [Myxococcota bacterium]MDW8283943.1 Crp/Fnr family transcriptional regulator [Myxococcales bacterium]